MIDFNCKDIYQRIRRTPPRYACIARSTTVAMEQGASTLNFTGITSAP